MTAFTFVHTADLHLDSPLRSLALRDEALAERVGSATREALDRIIALCLEERVDALLIAGDLFDGVQRSMQTVAVLRDRMRRLHEAGIDVFAIRGNHDAEAPVSRHLELPPNVHVFSGHGGIVEHPKGVAVQGVSFAGREARESLLPKYRPPVPDMPNIALLHTSLGGAEGHDAYAPCSLAELRAHGVDYWALGHVHRRMVHARDPWVVMPGMPQGRDIGEAGPKSATLVRIDDNGITAEERVTAILEFAVATTDIADLGDWDTTAETALSSLRKAGEAVEAEHAAVRLVLAGNTPLAWRLMRDREVLEADFRHALAEERGPGGGVYLDSLVLQTQPPSAEPHADEADPVAELDALMAEKLADGALRAEATAFLDTMVRALPQEIRDAFGADEEERNAATDRLLAEGRETVLAALRGAGRED
ncbi:MAG: DNA repair exonuclease [Pseudomonadota bacterium]